MGTLVSGGRDALRCGVVIVTFNSADDIEALLASLPAAAPGIELRVVVVDNASDDGTPATARDAALRHGLGDFTCVETGANLGYAAAINVGREALGTRDTTLVVNPDLRLEPESIVRLAEQVQAPGVGAVVPTLVDGDGVVLWSQRREPTILRAVGDAVLGSKVSDRPAWSSELVDRPDAYLRTGPIEWATGAALMTSAACDDAVGAWDESFFMYSEETDYAARIRDAGFRIVFVHTATAMHREGGSGRSPDLAALLALNRVRYFRKYHGRWPTLVFRLVVVAQEVARAWNPAHRRAAAVVAGFAPPPSFRGAPPIERVPA